MFPNRYLIQLMGKFAKNEMQKEKLQEMSGTTVDGIQSYFEYIVREKRYLKFYNYLNM